MRWVFVSNQEGRKQLMGRPMGTRDRRISTINGIQNRIFIKVRENAAESDQGGPWQREIHKSIQKKGGDYKRWQCFVAFEKVQPREVGNRGLNESAESKRKERDLTTPQLAKGSGAAGVIVRRRFIRQPRPKDTSRRSTRSRKESSPNGPGPERSRT